MSERDETLEEAAALCDQTADLYLAYSEQTWRGTEAREDFLSHWQTCADLANRIRALKSVPEPSAET